jgi:hypothetical protein
MRSQPRLLLSIAIICGLFLVALAVMPIEPATTVPPTPPPAASPSPTPLPVGGLWIEPKEGMPFPGRFHFAVRAYPTRKQDPAVAYVEFTLSWEGRGGPWLVMCHIDAPTHDDVYECDFDPFTNGVPTGRLNISFDVYNVRGEHNNAPNGIHHIVFLPGG